jgi:hypothetical protein
MAGLGFGFDTPSMIYVEDAHAIGRLWNLNPSLDFGSPYMIVGTFRALDARLQL